LRFLARIFDEFFSGFRAKFQKIVTCAAFSIKFAKTNQKFSENSEFCEKNSLLLVNYSLHSLIPVRRTWPRRESELGTIRSGWVHPSKPFYLHKLFRVFFDNDMGDDVTQNDDFQRQTTALEGLRKSEPFFKAWWANGPPLLIHLPPLFPIHLDAAFYASFTAPDGLPRIFVALRGSRGRRTEIFT
jgi:hypothetical protein